MKKLTSPYFTQFKDEILSHNLRSGEIILAIYEHQQSNYEAEKLLNELLVHENIKAENEVCEWLSVSPKEAIDSIKYGLSTKPNYTAIDQQFSEKEQNHYAFGFLSFFTNVQCYTTQSRIYQQDLNLNDFWEVGGVFVVGEQRVGVFWVNDLYDQF